MSVMLLRPFMQAVNILYLLMYGCIKTSSIRIEAAFTRGRWHGRMKACRGIGASLTEGEIPKWEEEYRKLLENIAPDVFSVLCYGAVAELRKNRV